jgi:hypothetical protein
LLTKVIQGVDAAEMFTEVNVDQAAPSFVTDADGSAGHGRRARIDI